MIRHDNINELFFANEQILGAGLHSEADPRLRPEWQPTQQQGGSFSPCFALDTSREESRLLLAAPRLSTAAKKRPRSQQHECKCQTKCIYGIFFEGETESGKSVGVACRGYNLQGASRGRESVANWKTFDIVLHISNLRQNMFSILGHNFGVLVQPPVHSSNRVNLPEFWCRRRRF